MAQQAIIYRNSAEDVYRHYYMLHGECLRLASVCSSIGFSYDKEINNNKILSIEEMSDNIMLLVSDLKNKLNNPYLTLT
jgi:hypothetical protein